jgi:large subunit ribosomal protein L17
MRHKISKGQLGRSHSLRKATLRDIAKGVLKYQSVVTTRARAKVARKLIDRLISLGKEGSVSSRRRAFAVLGDHGLVKLLFSDIALRYKKRPGGFTRIMYLLDRKGDGASQAILELTERVIVEKVKKEKPKKEAAQEAPARKEAAPAVETKPLPEARPEIKEKPAVKPPKPSGKPKPEEKPKAKIAEKPKETERPKQKEEKPAKKGLFGGIGKIFKKQRGS